MNHSTIQAGPYTLSYDRRTLVMGILNVTPDSFFRRRKIQYGGPGYRTCQTTGA